MVVNWTVLWVLDHSAHNDAFVLRYEWTHPMAVAIFLFFGRIFSKLKDDTLLPGRGNARIQIFCSWTFGNWTFQNKTQRGFKLSRFFCLEHFGKARVSMGTCTLWKFYTKPYGTWKWHPWRRDSFKNCISFKREMVVPLSLLHGG